MRSGAFGQVHYRGNVIFSSLLAMLLAGCGPTGNGRFVGVVTTTQGACGLGFDAQGMSTATLMERGKSVMFAPTDGVLVLDGHVDGGRAGVGGGL